jgi:hypothetical protein
MLAKDWNTHMMTASDLKYDDNYGGDSCVNAIVLIWKVYVNIS